MSTPMFNATALVVDDTDPSIAYSSGWLKVTSSAEYEQTKTGANAAGMTATFAFHGTGIEVYGSCGSIDVYGRPVSAYEIDGFPDTRVEYQADIIEPGSFTSHVLFYRSPILPDAEHTLVITNVNGTNPSVFWIDYIVYTPSKVAAWSPTLTASTPSTEATGDSTSSRSASITQPDGVTPSPSTGFTIHSSTSSPSFSPLPSSSPSSKARVIAGGVVGGVAFLAAITFLLYRFLYRKRRTYAPSNSVHVINPFTSRAKNRATYASSSLAEKENSLSAPSSNSIAAESTAPLPLCSSNLPSVAEPRHAEEHQPVVMLHEDSGVRLPPNKVLDIPPTYTDV